MRKSLLQRTRALMRSIAGSEDFGILRTVDGHFQQRPGPFVKLRIEKRAAH